ncbi:hypothetical protein OO007_19360 [Cocleimonas sp. KMM 6892]|uniref:hypothetical protein n=1 Tax=unclassified Cocleimonas TaxID=2639732 RepID=UPI002DB55B25|nr:MULTISPECIES: hypothetical protein [unclassified Cocleimonas]MEB8434406.1 hypothetical protein [Cocleimonas sp. KMM 6892]MEC4717299.1 hypothetical protein [Cocleimonas sp. KMM 6895]MEC4746678.1 hypothetical protein [Cocleimonas sp. KMM 6896]
MNYKFSKTKLIFIIILFSITAVFLYLKYSNKDECNIYSGTTTDFSISENFDKCRFSKNCSIKVIGGGGDPEIMDSGWTDFECITSPPGTYKEIQEFVK